MSLPEIVGEMGHGLLTQLPSALLAAMIMTAATAVSRRRRRNQTQEDGVEGDNNGA
ncbi:hypothetical protein [Streptomyces durocortorensis]|uniref:Uncharacterized protein n=1 Tax=Streptomyces durocortorensis TaxID=2811104 RepID=A0ABS2I5U2_9ACTN|nr:hypothetical protein [Streptomyces durocortorensis]MBM7058551.1 hypothetical protein [Streptomyces durocortorensis]